MRGLQLLVSLPLQPEALSAADAARLAYAIAGRGQEGGRLGAWGVVGIVLAAVACSGVAAGLTVCLARVVRRRRRLAAGLKPSPSSSNAASAMGLIAVAATARGDSAHEAGLPDLRPASSPEGEGIEGGSWASPPTPDQAPVTPAPDAAHPALPLPELPFSDWLIPEAELQVCTRPDGTPWELGSGAFGRVFRGLRGGVQPVALKVLHDGSAAAAEADDRAAFSREVAILRACRHPNIVAFAGVSQAADGRLLLVTEYCAGGDLWRALARPAAADLFAWPRWGRRVLLDVARGLVFLHDHRIAHLDVKARE